MSSANKAILLLMFITTVSLWGCTQNRTGSSSAHIRDLEGRNAKLEEDYRVAVADCTEIKKQLVVAEAQAAKLVQQTRELQSVTREREQLRQQMSATLTEKNVLHTQLAQFGRELQNLAGKIDAAVGGSTVQPATSATSAAPGGT
jgi:chromosome segregation ATPase